MSQHATKYRISKVQERPAAETAVNKILYKKSTKSLYVWKLHASFTVPV